MGLFGSVGKVVVREHAHAFGYTWVKAGGVTVRKQFQRLTKRGCPKCASGRLFADVVEVDGDSRRFFGCNKCDHFEAVQAGEDPDTMERLKLLADSKLSDPDTVIRAIRQHKISSRLLFCFAALCMLAAIAMVVASPHSSGFASVSMIGLFITVKALVSSYRCWQLQHGRIFEPGLFKAWFKSGEWFV